MNQSPESNKRLKQRFKAHDEYVIISLTYPKGSKLICDVIDINESGLSFKMSANEGFLSAGTPIKGLKLCSTNGKKAKTLAGIVRYARPFHNDGELCYKIGLEFIESRTLVGEKFYVPFPLRPKRYAADKFFKGESTVTFKSMDEVSYKGRLVDFSRYGAAIEFIKEVPILKISDILRHFKIIVEDEIIFSGDATVVRMDKIDQNSHVAVTFKEAILDLSKAISLKKKYDLEVKFKNLTLDLNQLTMDISRDFKAHVADLRYFLERLQQMLDEEEKNIADHASNGIRAVLLRRMSGKACEYVAEKLKMLQEITSQISPDQQSAYKAYFRYHLQSLFVRAPFLRRAYEKPLGFAGDYELMNFLYKDGLSGKDLFSTFLDFYTYSENAPKAVLNRVPYLMERIHEYISTQKKQGKKVISILNVGCGPAKEIQELIKHSDILDRCQLTLIDFSSEALLDAQEKILYLKSKNKREFSVQFIQNSVTQILSNSYHLKSHDLIYTIGLFDYLEDSLAKAVTRKLYKTLSKNGLLIIGNVDPANTTRFYMEYVMEWYIIYRTMKDMEFLAEDLKPSPEVRIEAEDTNTNNFLLIHRP